MAKILVIGSSGQIGVELIEQLAKIHGSSKIIASDINLNLNQNLQGVTYLKLDVLDKIKLSGYESLTKEEKDYLFDASKHI